MLDAFYAFHDKNYEKYLFRHIRNVVEVAKETYKRDLDKKRKRLKELLDAEDLAYENEFRVMVQGRLEETIRRRQETLLKIRNEKIRQNEEFLARKKAQKIMENSDKIRSMLSKNLLREAKACNLAQIEEKARRKQEEDELEAMWLCVRDKTLAIEDKRQEYEDRIRHEVYQNDKHFILQQMALQNYKDDETSEYISGGTGSLFYKRPSEDHTLALQRQKNIQNQREMIQYGLVRQKLLQENCEADKRLVETLNYHVEEEMRKEREQQIKPKTAQIFLDYCHELKKQKEEEYEQQLFSIEKQQAEYECKQLTAYKKRQEERKKLSQKAHDVLLGQIDYNNTKLYNDTIMRNEQHIADNELLLRDIAKEKDKEIKKRQINKVHQSELKAQALEQERRELEQKCKDRAEIQKMFENSEVVDDIAIKLITDDDTFLKSHPNWKLMGCGCKNPP